MMIMIVMMINDYDYDYNDGSITYDDKNDNKIMLLFYH